MLSIASLTLGWALTPLLCFAVHSPTFRNDAIFVPGLFSSIVALVILVLDFALTNRYQWTLPAWLGVAGAGASSVVYLVLATLTQVKINRINRRMGTADTEFEAPLLNAAAPIRYASPTPSYMTSQTVAQADNRWSTNSTHAHDSWGNNNSNNNETYEQQRRGSPFPFLNTQAPSPSPSHSPNNFSKPLPTSPAGVVRSTSLRRRSSLNSGVALPYSDGEAPVQTLRVPSPLPEEDQTRQQMLRLLLNQTSQQAMQNPDNQTFQIDIPADMREVLLRASTDEENIRRVVKAQSLYRGKARELEGDTRHSQHTRKRNNDYLTSSSGADKPPSARSNTKRSLLSVKELASPGGTSVMQTPASLYPLGQWKSREERRKEIELSPR